MCRCKKEGTYETDNNAENTAVCKRKQYWVINPCIYNRKNARSIVESSKWNSSIWVGYFHRCARAPLFILKQLCCFGTERRTLWITYRKGCFCWNAASRRLPSASACSGFCGSCAGNWRAHKRRKIAAWGLWKKCLYDKIFLGKREYRRWFMFFLLSALRRKAYRFYRQAVCGQPGRKLRWKQVQILHGPATVLTEPCS